MIPELLHLPMNPELKGQAELIGPLTYSRNGQKLILMLPWAPKDDRTHRAPCPVILFVQGSAWTSPNLNYEIPMLSRYAEEGFAVATVTHRSIADGFPFPAFLEDVKCAVRFLRAHAAQYALDPERIAAFGTSSGGHTVCMLGLTGDDPAFRTRFTITGRENPTNGSLPLSARTQTPGTNKCAATARQRLSGTVSPILRFSFCTERQTPSSPSDRWMRSIPA